MKGKANITVLTKDTDLPVRQTMADGSHQLESNQLRAPGGNEPHCKHSGCAGDLLLPPLFSALCPGNLVLKTNPSGLSCTLSSTWVWSRAGEAGVFLLCSLPASVRSPEVITFSWKSSPPGSFSSMVLAQNVPKYHDFVFMFPQPLGL